MFDHPYFDKYSFEEVPLDRDIYLVDEKWVGEYEEEMTKVFNGAAYVAVGYVGAAAARNILPSGIEFSWYPNHFTRFHEVRAWLPRDAFVSCVGSWQYDEKPRIFVKGDWLNHLYLRSYTIFALVDAIGVKAAIRANSLTREKLVQLRDRIDDLASQHKSVSFISFADSLLLKSNWTVGHSESDVKYTYEPELLLRLLAELRSIYRDVLGLKIYTALTQGSNEYYDDEVTHISSSRNHISLNSLGIPFAQLLAIDEAARNAIRSAIHGPADLYIDKLFYNSIRFQHHFAKKKLANYPYVAPMSEDGSFYYCASIDLLLENLDPEKP
jgi:hypothetical protein